MSDDFCLVYGVMIEDNYAGDMKEIALKNEVNNDERIKILRQEPLEWVEKHRKKTLVANSHIIRFESNTPCCFCSRYYFLRVSSARYGARFSQDGSKHRSCEESPVC